MEPDWEENFQAVGDAVLSKLGPQIEADAKRYCPVRTGALRDSITHSVVDHALIVKAYGSPDREYAVFVELGHQVTHHNERYSLARGDRIERYSTGQRFVAPRPFLRPALYQERGL
jgi:hypothetical protein